LQLSLQLSLSLSLSLSFQPGPEFIANDVTRYLIALAVQLILSMSDERCILYATDEVT
jgi:hypothetical protein